MSRGRLRSLGPATALSAAWLLAGCASPPSSEGPAEPAPFAVLESRPPAAPLEGDDLYPFRAGDRVQQIVGGEDAGLRIVFSGAPCDRLDAEYALVIGEERTEYWAHDDAGNIVMPAVIDHEQQALTRFDPPLLIAGRRMVAGEPETIEVGMRVLDARDPRRQRERGTATRTIEYVGDERVRTPLGQFTAQRVEIRFRADLTFARAVETTTCWVVPGVGVVAVREEEEVRILGLLGERKHRLLVLIEAATPDGEFPVGAGAPDGADRTD
jgi:hypothetical protein